MQSRKEKVTVPVNVSSDAVWNIISTGGGVDKWFSSMIESCLIDGDKRTCVTKTGVPLEEKILNVNHQDREFTFAIPEQTLLPISNIVEVMKVSDGDNGNSVIEWSATFDATDENAPIAQQALSGLWTQGISELEEYILSN